MNPYLAFDIEIAKVVPDDVDDWKSQRPLGISCMASYSTTCDRPKVWFTKTDTGSPSPQMSQHDIACFVDYLKAEQSKGAIPLSWNGLSFDLDILAEESGMSDECQSIAMSHVDMMFHIVCEKGFPVALKSAAAGLGVEGKLEGMDASDAPKLWAKGDYNKVIEYVAQDVKTTLAVAQAAERQKQFMWITQRGRLSEMPLPCGWLAVKEAMKLPLPDTSWMDDPPSREDFSAWAR